MFTSRFGRRTVGGINKFGPQDENKAGFQTNRFQGNSRTWPHMNNQDSNRSDSVNASQNINQGRAQENNRFSRAASNRRSYNSGSWRRQPLVRQAETSQSLYQRGNSKLSNKPVKLQPEVIGTKTFTPQVKQVQESHSPRNPRTNDQRRLSIVSEQPSDISSSFCYINQGNLPKSTGLDTIKQLDITVFSPEPNESLIDYCIYCINRQQKLHPASHHCSDCGPFGRYMCQSCLQSHNEFTENHNIQSLSGKKYRKKSEEESETEEPVKKGEHPNFLRDVPVNTTEDDQSCQITGFCQLNNGTIVLTEMNNKAIKTLDCQTYKILHVTKLLNYPMDICCIGDNVALVILYKCTIQYITVNEHSEVEQTDTKVLEHDCVCLAYCDEKVYVGSSKSLYIYDKDWTELDKITNDLLGDERIFSDQFSIAVSMNNELTTVYIADESTGLYVIELTPKELTIVWKFKDCNSFKASGLCFDSSRNLLLSDRGSERLIKMNAEGMILAILLNSQSGVQPLNLPFYNKVNDNLIVSLSGKNFIKVFDFK